MFAHWFDFQDVERNVIIRPNMEGLSKSCALDKIVDSFMQCKLWSCIILGLRFEDKTKKDRYFGHALGIYTITTTTDVKIFLRNKI